MSRTSLTARRMDGCGWRLDIGCGLCFVRQIPNSPRGRSARRSRSGQSLAGKASHREPQSRLYVDREQLQATGRGLERQPI